MTELDNYEEGLMAGEAEEEDDVPLDLYDNLSDLTLSDDSVLR